MTENTYSWTDGSKIVSVPAYKRIYLPRPNESLYHYTDSDEALFDIIRNNRIRLSRADQMNDSSEILYGRKVVGSWIEKRGIGADISLKKPSDYFVFSASDLSDDSNMWYRYAGNGEGYCIELSDRFSEGGVQKVEFDSSVDYQRFDGVLYGGDSACELLEELSQNKFWKDHLEEMANYYISRIKQAGWKMECEYRLSVAKSKCCPDKIVTQKSGQKEFIYLGLDYDNGEIPLTGVERKEKYSNKSEYMKWRLLSACENIENRPKLIKSITISKEFNPDKLLDIKCEIRRSGYSNIDSMIKTSEIV